MFYNTFKEGNSEKFVEINVSGFRVKMITKPTPHTKSQPDVLPACRFYQKYGGGTMSRVQK